MPAGLLLAFMYERRGLAASLGAHMAYNGGLLFLAALATRAVAGRLRPGAAGARSGRQRPR